MAHLEEVKQTKSDNELIAEFMGYSNPHDLNGVLLKYRTSWDWLMPVVEKIRTTGYSNEVSFGIDDSYSSDGTPKWSVHIGAQITRWNKDENGKLIWPNTSYKIKMETVWWHGEKELLPTVYKAVVAFIKWYNQQNPTPHE